MLFQCLPHANHVHSSHHEWVSFECHYFVSRSMVISRMLTLVGAAEVERWLGLWLVQEALETVKEHVANVMGPSSMAYSNTRLKMSKLQAAQVQLLALHFLSTPSQHCTIESPAGPTCRPQSPPATTTCRKLVP